ncbi:MAG: gliding motility-associated C-terminal domain-containing protein [Paludibacteraceae bacterium]|nr:gliding motility-associated C-terminal domain-containing protein [Paludibacteraceae bacterium]
MKIFYYLSIKQQLKFRFIRFGFVFYLVLFLITFTEATAQEVDWAHIGDERTYGVANHRAGSMLFWSVSGGEIVSENPSLNAEVIVKWTHGGVGELSVYEQTTDDCTGDISTAQITVIDNNVVIRLNIPNVFTPNGDATNNAFFVEYNHEPLYYNIIITNRWGRKVFETDDINKTWSGGDSEAGAYFYIVSYQSEGKIVTKNGFVYLFR